MSNLRETHVVEAPLDPTQINDLEGKVWRRPKLTIWMIEEETLGTSGPVTFGALKN